MKKTIKTWICISIAFGFILFGANSCKKNNEVPKSTRVTLKGHFSSTKSSVSENDPSTATKVVVFDNASNFSVSNIIDKSFSVQVNKENPVGLIFTNDNDAFLGYLTLNKGFESIPLNFLNDTVATIDFGLLQNSIQKVTPSNSSIFNTFQMTQEMIKNYIFASLNFSAIILNPDIDRNGKIDILENKEYSFFYLYFADGGSFSDLSAMRNNPNVSIESYRLTFCTNDNNSANQVKFIFSDGTTISSLSPGIGQDGKKMYGSDLMDIGSLSNYSSFKVVFNTDTLYFNVPNQSLSINNFTNIIPNCTISSNKLQNFIMEIHQL